MSAVDGKDAGSLREVDDQQTSIVSGGKHGAKGKRLGAKVIAAEGEHQASRSLANAAEVIAASPAALQVRRSGTEKMHPELDFLLHCSCATCKR